MCHFQFFLKNSRHPVVTWMMNALALSDLLNRLGPSLTLLARQYTNCADDAVQDAFVQLAGLKAIPSHVEAWLFRAVKHRALDYRKTEARRKRREESHQPSSWFCEHSIDGMDAEQAVQALTNLPEEEREIIIARLWGSLSLQQIADAFGCSVATVHRRFEAGITRLREQLGEAKWNH